MLLEGTGFALGVGIYLYLMSLAPEWPLSAPPPNLAPGVAMTAFLLVSLVPNYLVGRWAHEGDLTKSRIGIVMMTVVGIVPLFIRYFEFAALNTRWDSNAYGSIVWTLLGLHTTHLDHRPRRPHLIYTHQLVRRAHHRRSQDHRPALYRHRLLFLALGGVLADGDALAARAAGNARAVGPISTIRSSPCTART